MLPAGCSGDIVLASVKKGKPAEKESDASSDYPAEENLQEEGRAVHLLRGQRGGYRKQQGRDEGLRHHWSSCQGVRGPVAEDSLQRLLYLLVPASSKLPPQSLPP